MKELLAQLLSSETEAELLEFKEAKNQYDKNKLGRYFSALSNEANINNKTSAYIVFGIDNNKNIVGTDISENQINHYKQEIAHHTSPNIGFKKVDMVIINQAKVILFEIPAALPGMPICMEGTLLFT
jgi:ATP-dependent DNA helicase RecG